MQLPLTNILTGLPHYYPICQATNKVGIPVTVHPNSGEGIFRTSPPMAGGTPAYYVERHSGLSQVFQANVISLVCHGVFERFPNLKVIITEGGLGWIPDVMWRLGAADGERHASTRFRERYGAEVGSRGPLARGGGMMQRQVVSGA